MNINKMQIRKKEKKHLGKNCQKVCIKIPSFWMMSLVLYHCVKCYLSYRAFSLQYNLSLCYVNVPLRTLIAYL